MRSPSCMAHGVMTYGSMNPVKYPDQHITQDGNLFYCGGCIDNKKEIEMRRTAKRCNDCRDGEHDNYDDNVLLAIVRDPDTGAFVKRAYLCEQHIEMYLDDGYTVTITR